MTGTDCTCPSGDGSLRWPCPEHPPVEGDLLVTNGRIEFHRRPAQHDSGQENATFEARVARLRDRILEAGYSLDVPHDSGPVT